MKEKTIMKTVLSAAAGTAAMLAGKEKVKKYLSAPDNKRQLMDFGDKAVQKLFGKLADSVPDKGIPFINRYDSAGFMEGSGYFLSAPAEGSGWQLGYAKHSVVPEKLSGDLYIGGYLAFPPNKLTGIMNEQTVRAAAVDDGSGRGINIFAVIDCIGLCGADIRKIRKELSGLIAEKNIVSVNISATHCHSGIDTEGLWGDLIAALKKNKKAVKNGCPEEAVSGKNPEFMKYLIEMTAETVTKAVSSMKPGALSYKMLPTDDYVHDKRPPYIPGDYITVLRFVPADGSKELRAVFMAAHPTCYGDKQREASCDFPKFMCDALEEKGMDAMFIQGAECAVAANRGPHTPDGLTGPENIQAYGEAIAEYVFGAKAGDFTEIPPLLNVRVSELFLPADNKILEYAAKMKVVDNLMVRFTDSDAKKVKPGQRELCFPTEVGFAELGGKLSLVMVPGELMPEIVFGGAFSGPESYTGKEWDLPPIRDILGTDTAVIGLCNDFIGYIIPDNDFGSMFAPLHYEESVSAGGRTASNIVHAFERMKKDCDSSRL